MRKRKSTKKPKQGRGITSPALSFPHIFVYEASAGSGKTRRLAQRYIDFLLNYSNKTPVPFNFRNLLAVTFTNEAADQMKQEILRMLKSRALGEDEDSSLAMQIVDEIIHNFSDFAVRTIDSFVHSLLVASSLELKLPPDYEITPETQPYLEYVLDIFLDEAVYNQDIVELLLGFLNHFLVIEGQKHWNPRRMLLGLLTRFYREENARAKLFREIPGDLDLSQTEKQLKEKVGQCLASLPAQRDVNQKFINGLSVSLDSSGANFLKILNRYVNKTLSPGEGILKKDAQPANADLLRNWAELKSQYDNYAHAFVWLKYSFYLKVFAEFRKRMEDYKQEKRIVFLEELNKKARQFLTSEGLLPAEIYYKLSLVFYHYLIDEFQDTSILQWENIQALVEDALAKGGSLFYVGDKKQAIYRFRGGEVQLFDLIKSRFKKQVVKVYDQSLLCNYRSRRAIVEFNNSVFSQKNLKHFLDKFPQLNKEFQQRVLVVFKDSQQQPAAADSRGGYVRLEELEAENSEQLQDILNIKVKQTLRDLKKRFNYQDILILVRDNQEAEGLAAYLLEQEFPVCASRTISIRQNYLIRQIIALLKFLNSPIDNLCFANVILGEIFIKATKLSPENLQLWLEEMRINQDRGVLYTKFRSEFPQVWEEFLQYLFGAVGFLPVYDLLESILIKFKIEDNFPQLCGFTQRLLEILNVLQEQGRNSLADFLEWWENAQEEDLFVQLSSGLDAIRILTIHKAKGLSSPVVILPYAILEIKVGEVAFEAPKIVHETPEGLYLLYPQKDICLGYSELAPIYQKEYFQALLDELNCLYVGMTRAASELYIFIPKRINRGRNPAISLLLGAEENVREFGSRKTYRRRPKRLSKQAKKNIKPTRVLPQERFGDIFKSQLIQAQQIGPLEKRYLINRGEVLHYLLAGIDPSGFLKDRSLYVEQVKDACRLFNYPESEQITQCLYDFFNHSKMQQFFNPEFPAFNEKEIADKYGNLRRIDRLVFAKDKIWIIDYKTGEGYQPEHEQQIREYAQLISELYPKRIPECWLIYVDTKEARLV